MADTLIGYIYFPNASARLLANTDLLLLLSPSIADTRLMVPNYGAFHRSKIGPSPFYFILYYIVTLALYCRSHT